MPWKALPGTRRTRESRERRGCRRCHRRGHVSSCWGCGKTSSQRAWRGESSTHGQPGNYTRRAESCRKAAVRASSTRAVIAYAQPQTKVLKDGLDDLSPTTNTTRIANPTLKGYVDQLDQIATQPQGAKFTELDNLRSALAEQARGPIHRHARGRRDHRKRSTSWC